MKFSALLVTALISFSGLNSQAGSASDNLKAIQDRLNIKFCSLLTDVQKIQVTQQVYNFLTATPNQNTYGFGKLVDSLYIDCPSAYNTPAKTEANSRLRNHGLIVNYDLSSLALFENRIVIEEEILADINFITQYSIFTFKRNLDLLTQTTASNESFLQFANNLIEIVPRYLTDDTFKDVEQIIINHGNNSYNNPSAALVNSFYHKNKRVLIVNAGPVDLEAQSLEVLIRSVTQLQFAQIDTNLLDSNLVNSTLINFSNYSTEDVLALLHANGVKQITFREHPEQAQNLFVNGTLILGNTIEGMEFVVNLLFR